jgi:transcriptional regulator with AAA-type ATPase domain/transcriptional regulatory protein LevR
MVAWYRQHIILSKTDYIGVAMKQIEQVYLAVYQACKNNEHNEIFIGVTTNEMTAICEIRRSNMSRLLNTLVHEGRLHKSTGRPVRYSISTKQSSLPSKSESTVFGHIIGSDKSLKNAIQQAKSAMMYPPNGLHTILIGETGVGKSMFAEQMYQYAKQIKRIRKNAPLISFNCADYANNPQLLLLILFGAKKGSFTGADEDRDGLVKKADGGILFLDEIHRLPPEGQEMLFYLLDKGTYRQMGENNTIQKSQIIFLCATTENIDSGLLRTFLRRIPMIINLPPLREMTIEERWELVQWYFMQQAEFLKIPISVTANVIRSFLSYNCANNIGQLISDIKLCCARTYLEYTSKNEKEMVIHYAYLPNHVQKGLLLYKENQSAYKTAKLPKEPVIFTVDNFTKSNSHAKIPFNIYDALDQKSASLKEEGLNEMDAHLLMSLEVDHYLDKYIHRTLNAPVEELHKIVDQELIALTQVFVDYAFKSLNLPLNDRNILALALHISCTLERLKKGMPINNPNLNEIKTMHPIEFTLASKFVTTLEKEYHLEIPADEIGFIAMFLLHDKQLHETNSGRVGVIVAMHGESSATSMVDVSNRLLATNHAHGYNMSLDQKVETALENLIELVKHLNDQRGIILLVDMGSLLFLGDLVYKRTQIPIKTIEMVSTPMVLEATRRAMMDTTLEEVYQSVIDFSPYIGRMYDNHKLMNQTQRNNVIITACITGEGTAIKLKSIIENSLLRGQNKWSELPDILPIDIMNLDDYNQKLHMIQQKKKIIAVVSNVKPQNQNLHYISTEDLLLGNGISQLNHMITTHEDPDFFHRMHQVIQDHVEIQTDTYMHAFQEFLFILQNENIFLDQSILSGLILHIACVIEKSLQGNVSNQFPVDQTVLDQNQNTYSILKKAFIPFSQAFKIEFPKFEYANAIKLIQATQ